MQLFPEALRRGMKGFLAPREDLPLPEEIAAESFEDFKKRVIGADARSVTAVLRRDELTPGVIEHSVLFSALGRGQRIGYAERYEEGTVNADPQSIREQAITKRLIFTADQRLRGVLNGLSSSSTSRIYIGLQEFLDYEREDLRRYAIEHKLETLTPIVNSATPQPVH